MPIRRPAVNLNLNALWNEFRRRHGTNSRSRFNRAAVRFMWRLVNACSQIRTTRQPACFKSRLTVRSRCRLPRIFARQNLALCFGQVACAGHPCQKQPSTNTASRARGKTKSGLPANGCRRRQPLMRGSRKSATNRSSVSLLPEPRIRAITAERFALVKTSGTRWQAAGGRDFATPLGFFGMMDEHPIVKSRPLRVAGIQLFVGQFARIRAPPSLGGESLEHTRPAAVGVDVICCLTSAIASRRVLCEQVGVGLEISWKQQCFPVKTYQPVNRRIWLFFWFE